MSVDTADGWVESFFLFFSTSGFASSSILVRLAATRKTSMGRRREKSATSVCVCVCVCVCTCARTVLADSAENVVCNATLILIILCRTGRVSRAASGRVATRATFFVSGENGYQREGASRARTRARSRSIAIFARAGEVGRKQPGLRLIITTEREFLTRTHGFSKCLATREGGGGLRMMTGR